MGKIKVLIADDHPVVREGLRAMLMTDQNIEIVGESGDGAEAVKMVAEKRPNVVLADIRLPNMDGVEATRRIKDKRPSTAVIVFTLYDNGAYVLDAVRAGASGYLLKDTSRELLLHTIQAVSGGATLIKTTLLSEAIASLVPPQKVHRETVISSIDGVEPLTSREREVLKLVAVGYTNKEVGEKLTTTEDTVKKHMQNILAKLHATSRIRAAIETTRAGIIK